MRRLAFAILRLYCSDCQHIVWFWQARCRSSHRTCMHRRMLSLYEVNRAMTPAIDFPMWECAGCGQVPA